VLHGPFPVNCVLAPFITVFVFNNAAHRNVRHGKGLGDEFDIAGLDNRFLERLAGEFDDGTIRVDGARF
jgi:hypothetical protein